MCCYAILGGRLLDDEIVVGAAADELGAALSRKLLREDPETSGVSMSATLLCEG